MWNQVNELLRRRVEWPQAQQTQKSRRVKVIRRKDCEMNWRRDSGKNQESDLSEEEDSDTSSEWMLSRGYGQDTSEIESEEQTDEYDEEENS